MTATLGPVNNSIAEPKRDRYGRYLIVPDGGGKPAPYTRATTIADCLSDRFWLEQWKQRQVAVGLARRTDLVAQAATVSVDDKQALNKIVGEAMSAAESDRAANLGTALHAAVEAVNRDGDAAVPDMLAADVDAYRTTLERLNIAAVAEHVEQVVVNEPIGAAGTFDLLVDVDGKRYVADLKTGKSVDLSAGSFAIQLAIYATATSYYDYSTERHTSPVDVSKTKALIIHLAAGTATCDVYWLDIKAGAQALKHAMWVREWRKRKGLLVPFADGIPAARRRALEAKPAVPVTCGHAATDMLLAAAFAADCMWARADATGDDRQTRCVATLRAVADHVDDIDAAAAIVCDAVDRTPADPATMWDVLGTATLDDHVQIRAMARVAQLAYRADGTPYVAGVMLADPQLQTATLDQLRPLIAADKKAVADAWPPGVPTPRQHTDWTVLHIEAIGKAYRLPFPPDVTAEPWEDF